MGSKKKIIAEIAFLIVVIALTLYAVFYGQDLGAVLSHLHSADLRILLPMGVLLVLLFIWSEALVFWYLFRTIDIEVGMGRCYLYAFIGFFFSCITPSASGGQPMQLFYMRKDGLPIPQSTLVLLVDCIIFKLVLVVMGVLVFLFRPSSIMHAIAPMMFWMWVGMGLNVIGITFMILFVFRPKFMHWLLTLLLTIVGKIPFIRVKDEYFKKLDELMQQYQEAADFMAAHMRQMVIAFVMVLIGRFTLFAVTAGTYLSFHLKGTPLWEITTLQCLISLAADMLPLPGGMGVTERLFLSIFRPAFGPELVLPAMILTRGISYYAQLLISAVMTVVAHLVIGRERRHDRYTR